MLGFFILKLRRDLFHDGRTRFQIDQVSNLAQSFSFQHSQLKRDRTSATAPVTFMGALERLFHRSSTNDIAMKRVSSRRSEFVCIDQLLLRIKVPRWTNRGTRARTRNALSFKNLGGAITCVLPIEDAAAHCANSAA